MSADNWTVCPQCAARDPFIGNGDEVQTLREDYEFHMTREGVLTAKYRARCIDCGFLYEFKRTETALRPKSEPSR